MRNIYTQIDQGSKILLRHKNNDITYHEIRDFLVSFNETEKKHGRPTAVFTTIEDAFLMGVAVGYKTAKSESDPSMTPKINLK